MLRKVGECMKKDFIVRRSITMVDGKPHVETYSEQELVRCKDCIHYRYYGLSKETISECTIDHTENPDGDWFCADGERKSD
jgi:hypothetical protein